MSNKDQLEPILFKDLSQIIDQGKLQVSRQVNSTLTLVYWQVGHRINKFILEDERADYAERIIPALSEQLIDKYGKSFALRNLRRMIQFAQVFPDLEIVSPLVTQLSWTHFITLLPIKNKEKRHYYALKSAEEGWSKRQLEYQIERKSFERKEIAQSQNILKSRDVQSTFKDPYILDFWVSRMVIWKTILKVLF